MRGGSGPVKERPQGRAPPLGQPSMRLPSALPLLAASLILSGGDAQAQHPRATFAGARGPGVLRWEMSCEEARTALERTGARPAAEEATGIFEGGSASGGWAEITFQSLHWRAAGREAHAECESFRLVSVRYVRRGLPTEARARAAVGPFVSRYGRASDERDTEYSAHVWAWHNATTQLSLVVVEDPSARGTWNVIEEWAPASSARGSW